MKCLVALLLCSNFAWAEDIEEARGLEDEVPVQTARTRTANSNWRQRSYILLEGISRNNGSPAGEFPNLEGSLTTDYKTARSFTYFLDGLVNYTQNNQKTQGYINQIGMRFEANDRWIIAAGKERNRRSPGIIVSPSDLLFTQTNLPGLREDRRGVWAGRVSYQPSRSSYDIFVLPVDRQNEGGWPAKDNKYMGTIGRTLQQFENWDISISAGDLNQAARAGLAAQGIILELWKIYYEAGYYEKTASLLGREIKDASQHLLGFDFEGSDDFSVKAEYFFNGLGLNSGEYRRFLAGSTPQGTALIPFPRRQYALLSASALEIFDHYNLTSSLVKSLEDSTTLTLARAEYLATDHLVAGITAIFLTSSQQYNFDLKYTF